jgi:HlyD family secretion protein
MKRRIGVSVAVVLVVGGAVAWYSFRTSKPKAAVRYETAKVERGRVIGRVTATGTLSAIVTVQVGSQVSGRIQKLLVDFNSPVKKGQIIATIDPELFKAAVEQARANLSAAEGNLVKSRAQAVDAKRQFDRARELFERKLIAQADRDTAEANHLAAEAQNAASGGTVEQARASLHQAAINLKYCTIVSPIDGTVISRNVDVGQTVAAALQAPTLFTIAEDLRKMQVDTSVAESDVGKLSAGLTATFTVDAYTSERFTGTVRQIRNAPQTVQNVVTYDAVIDVVNGDLKLKPGMTANVTFTFADRKNVLRVPNAALRFKPPPEMLDGDKHRGGRGSQDGGAVAVRSTGEGRESSMPASAPGDAGRRSMGHGGKGHGGKGPAAGGAAQIPSAPASAPAAARAPRERDREEKPDSRVVWVLRNEKPVRVKLRVGVSDGSFTEVIEGDVREGDLVILEVIGSEGRGRPPGGGPGGMRRIL